MTADQYLRFSMLYKNYSVEEQRSFDVNHPRASANQNVSINIPREELEECPPCFPHKLRKHNNGAKDDRFGTKPSK